MKSTRSYTDFNEFVKNEPEAVKSLIETWAGNIEGDEDKLMTNDDIWNGKDYEWTDKPITEMSELIEALRESGDGTEEVDSCYITETYQTITSDNKFCFEVIGQSYRKDQSLCEEEMLDDVYVTDLVMMKAEKTAKKEEAKNKDKVKWDNWFKDKTIKEIVSQLRETKFPSNLK